MQWWESLAARIDGLTLRERTFVMAGALALTYFAWGAFVMQPLEKRQSDLRVRQERVNAELAGLNASAQALLAQVRQDPNEVYRQELQQARAELARLNENLAGTTNHLVAPREMARVLEAVLQGTSDLRLERVESLGSSPLIEQKVKPAGKGASASAQEPAHNVFKHGLRLTLQGSYFGVLEFMRRIEALEWKFFWDSVEFRVVDYPDATVEITVFTISLDPSWIGA